MNKLILALSIFVNTNLSVAGSFLPLDINQLIENSKTIISGVVIDKDAKWNSKGTLITTDYHLEIEKQLLGFIGSGFITIPVLGGTIGNDAIEISSSTHLQIGERYLLFIDKQDSMSVFTGGSQGVLSETTYNLKILKQQQRKQNTINNFEQFLIQMQNIIDEKKYSVRKRVKPATSTKVNPNYLYKEYDNTTDKQSTINEESSYTKPKSKEGNDANSSELNKPQAYVVEGSPPAYIVFEVMQNGFFSNNTAPYDQYMMSKWNRYADIFRVATTSDGLWRSGNGVNEIAGFVDNDTMVAQFGSGWGDSTLAVTSSWKNLFTNKIIESDIAINPNFQWSSDEEYATRHDNNFNNIQQTILHELGHSFGLQHPWKTRDVWWDSVMNYAPKAYRFARLFADDTTAIRAHYPGQSKSLSDGLISAYTTADSSLSNNAKYTNLDFIPSITKTGDILNFSGQFKIENVGTTDLHNPTVDVYLCPERMSFNDAVYIDTWSYTGDIQTHGIQHINASTNTTVPLSVPSGFYFLCLEYNLSSDDYLGNNQTWGNSDNKIYVSNSNSTPTTQEQLREAFIERFYQNILGRTADSGGMAHWKEKIQATSAETVVMGFFFSTEFLNLNLNDSQFVTILYNTLFDRSPDAGGYQNWINHLNNGMSRLNIVYGFTGALEFHNLADKFGVKAQ